MLKIAASSVSKLALMRVLRLLSTKMLLSRLAAPKTKIISCKMLKGFIELQWWLMIRFIALPVLTDPDGVLQTHATSKYHNHCHQNPRYTRVYHTILH